MLGKAKRVGSFEVTASPIRMPRSEANASAESLFYRREPFHVIFYRNGFNRNKFFLEKLCQRGLRRGARNDGDALIR